LKLRGQKKVYHANSNYKNAGIVIPISK
jgi:hypothetical protein